MTLMNSGARSSARALLFLATTLSAGPALADHVGPAGIGSGGGMAVFGPDTLDDGQAAAGFRFLLMKPEQRSDEELADLAGQHIHAHNNDYNLNASLGFAYGITHHLTLSGELPYVRRDDLREGSHAHSGGAAINGVEDLGSVSGIGDLSLLAKYRLTEGGRIGVALVAGLKVPTGSTSKLSSEGERLETEHQPGTGSWDPFVGASLGTTAGPLRVDASAMYQFSGNGAQDTRLGDRFQGGIVLSHRFAPPEHHHQTSELDEQQEEHPHSSWDAFLELGGEWEGRQKVGGELEEESGGTWIYAAPGVRYNSASGWSAAASLALPLWQDIRLSHADNRYRLALTIGRTF